MASNKLPRMGNYPVPELIAVPVAAGAAAIYAGNLVGQLSTGTGAIGTASGVLRILGRAAVDLDNSAGTATQMLDVEKGVFYMPNGSGANALALADVGRTVYLSAADGTANKSDANGAYPILGEMVHGGGSDGLGAGPFSGKVAVLVGGRGELDTIDLLECRGCATNLMAITHTAGAIEANANAALGTQDGLTMAVGDILFFPKGTVGSATVTDAMVGPWKITALGSASAKFTATRPSWYRHGSRVPAAPISIRSGTLFGGVRFRAFCAASATIGTTDPEMWPGLVTVQKTFVSGTSGSITTIPIKTGAQTVCSNTGTAAHASTRTWRPTTFTVGDLGTATLVWSAESAPGTTNTSDVGVYTISVHAWS